MKEYSTYKCADFASNQAFINWVQHPDPNSDAFWAAVVTSHPGLEKEIEDAKLLVQSMQFEEKEFTKDDAQALWHIITTDTHKKNKTIVRYLYAGVACAASIAVLFGLWQWLGNNSDKQSDALVEFAANTARPVTTGNDIQVVLSDQTNYTIATDHSELKYDEKGQLTVDSQEVTQQQIPTTKKEEIKFNQVIVPWGKRTTISFADGTRMWLNAGSRAIYPVEFTGNKREVYIEGEAFFEVTKDASKPFVVKTGIIEICVTGTSFNVNSYPKDDNLSIALVTGTVEVKQKGKEQITLKPNQAMHIDKKTLAQELLEVDVFDYICWREGLLRFKSETLKNVLRRIERHYAIPVAIKDTLEQYHISGKLDLRNNIAEALDIVAKLAPIRYEITNNEVFIYKSDRL